MKAGEIRKSHWWLKSPDIDGMNFCGICGLLPTGDDDENTICPGAESDDHMFAITKLVMRSLEKYGDQQ